jgi:NADH-quinone oxidoreductase subunit G
MCSRCVRFTREVSGTGELQILHRGAHAEIDVFPGNPCDNKLAGNVVDICPVGALCSKDFLYKQRVWFLKSEKSVCPGCSTGCSVNVDQNKNIVYRLKPRFNPQAQGHFMCDEGRFGFKYINSKERLLTPQHRVGEKYEHATWEKVLPEIRGKLKDAARNYPETVGAMLSPWLTCEEAYLLCRWLRELSSKIRLAMGPIRLVGEDDRYPKDSHGNSPPVDQAKFTIRAEKCPNRRGVEAILRHYQGEVCSPDSLYHAAVAGELKTLYLVGGDPLGWITPEQATWLKNVHLLIVQDMLESPASSRAQYVLPSGSFAEKDGTFVNHARLAQAVHRAIVPPGEARADGRIFMELAELRGLYHAPTIRQQLAKEIPWFAPLASGDLGDFGVFLGEQ